MKKFIFYFLKHCISFRRKILMVGIDIVDISELTLLYTLYCYQSCMISFLQ